MKKQTRTREQLEKELEEMRPRVAELEKEITERKRVGEELQESEGFLVDLLNAIQDGISVLDCDLNVIRVNSWIEEMYAAEMPLVGKKCYMVYQKRESPCPWCPSIPTIKTGEMHIETVPYPSAEKPTGWIELSAFPIKDARGHLVGAIEHVKDITERKRAQDVLTESEEKYRLLVDNFNHPLTVYDSNGLILLMNVAGARNFSLTPDDFIGKSLHDFFPDTADVYVERARRIFESGVGLEFEDEVPLPSGNRWFYSNIQPIKDASGKVISVQNISYDITDRKRAEEALKKSEKKLSIIFESISDGIIVSDLEGQIVDENEAAVRLQGYSDKEEVIGRNGFEFIAERDRARATEDAMKAIEMGYGPAHEYTFVGKDGREYDAEASASLLRDSAGNASGFISIFRDITERKRAEEALKKSEEKLRVMFESITDGIVVTDLQGKITEVNDMIVQMTGLSREEIIGKDGFSLIPREDRDKIVEEGKKVIKEDTGLGRRVYEVSPNVGRSSTTNLILGTMHDSEGNPTGFVAIAQDITERKRAEEALKASEEKLRVMFESITDGIVVTDLQGKITEVNDMIVQMTGLSREEFVGKDAFALIPREERDKIRMDMTQTLEQGDALGVRSYTLVDKDGREFNTEFSTAVLRDSSGNISNFVGVGRDVTERKRAEKERERLLADLEDKSQELEQLVFIASHDLRSPLVNIQGFAREIEQSLQQIRSLMEEKGIPSSVKEKVTTPIDEDIADSLSYILTSSSKIDSMLTGLLKVSRLGRVTFTIEKINMKDLMAEVVDSFEFQIREAGVKLEVGRLPQCRGDRAQINQVFSNLIDNALKFLDPERPGVIRIYGRKEGNKAVYTVEDNGIGIAPEHHRTIFQIFRRFSPMDTPGEGLGLNIVRRILDRHGGKIWLESEPGKGSRFHVSLPIRD